MRVILDTCVVSELQRKQCAPQVRNRVDAFETKQLFLSVITIGELAKGIVLLPEGGRRSELSTWMLEVEQNFAGQILSIDVEVAQRWGELTARNQIQGKVVPVADGLIAATALRHGLHVMTRNSDHFIASGAQIINPWES